MKEEIRLFPRLRRYEGGRCDQMEQNGFLEIASLARAAKADHRKTLDLLSDIRLSGVGKNTLHLRKFTLPCHPWRSWQWGRGSWHQTC